MQVFSQLKMLIFKVIRHNSTEINRSLKKPSFRLIEIILNRRIGCLPA